MIWNSEQQDLTQIMPPLLSYHPRPCFSPLSRQTAWASATSKACLCSSARGMSSFSHSIPSPDISCLQRIMKPLNGSPRHSPLQFPSWQLTKASGLWRWQNDSKWTSARPKKEHWWGRERDKSHVLNPVTFIRLPTSLTSERQKPFECCERADKPLNHAFSKYNFYRKLVSLLLYHKKVWTHTLCMSKLYLPHVEDWECTIKDYLQNEGSWYSKHANYLH